MEGFKGWFAELGSNGVLLQNVINVLMPLIFAFLAVYFVMKAIQLASALGAASTASARKEAKQKLVWLIIGIIMSIVAPTLILGFMNTIGSTTIINTDAVIETGTTTKLIVLACSF